MDYLNKTPLSEFQLAANLVSNVSPGDVWVWHCIGICQHIYPPPLWPGLARSVARCQWRQYSLLAKQIFMTWLSLYRHKTAVVENLHDHDQTGLQRLSVIRTQSLVFWCHNGAHAFYLYPTWTRFAPAAQQPCLMFPVLLGWSGMGWGSGNQPPTSSSNSANKYHIMGHGFSFSCIVLTTDISTQLHQYSSQACYRCSTITMVSSSLLQNSQFRILVLRLVATIIHYYSETVRAQNAASDCEFCNSQKTTLLATLSIR